MKKMSTLGLIAFVLVLIGSFNWGLMGFFKFDLIRSIFGELSVLSRSIYALVGLSGLYLIVSNVVNGKE